MPYKMDSSEKFYIFLGIFSLSIIYYSLRSKIKEDFSNEKDISYLIRNSLRVVDVYDKSNKLYNLKRVSDIIVPDFPSFLFNPLYVFYEDTNNLDLQIQFEKIGYTEIKEQNDDIHDMYTKVFIPSNEIQLQNILKPDLYYDLNKYLETMNFLTKKVILKMDLYKEENFKTFNTCLKNILFTCPCVVVSIDIHYCPEKFFEIINKDFFLMHIQLDNCNKLDVLAINDGFIKGTISKRLRLTYIHKKYVSSVEEKKTVHLPNEIDLPMCIGENLELVIKYG